MAFARMVRRARADGGHAEVGAALGTAARNSAHCIPAHEKAGQWPALSMMRHPSRQSHQSCSALRLSRSSGELPACMNAISSGVMPSGGDGGGGGAGGAGPPIKTVGHPTTIVPPCAVRSLKRAAGDPPMRTVVEPVMIVSGPPAQTSMSPIRAAGRNPISTTGAQGGSTGPPTCGTTPDHIGQTCMSLTRAAGSMRCLPSGQPPVAWISTRRFSPASGSFAFNSWLSPLPTARRRDEATPFSIR